ncbi:hypothetical protein M011DRAFT_439645 [Sporormia fimetaria CBS 119925]|uniref:ATP-grasp domain-containing protein n=1 Tax=Sporormia fimetaria CBS 119925 TaxID=1340428 RepID=A0A6A6VFE6_9PLEO|nr:hypothetical protein M011DRAFT_439645 [Sporormia fimetaria CBS 119925]
MAAEAFFYNHVPKNVLLVLLSLATLPISTLAVTACVANYGLRAKSRGLQQQHAPHPKTILITGVSMTKGLCLSRIFARYSNHRIIGADIEPIRYTCPGRYSRSLSKFIRLPVPSLEDEESYTEALLRALDSENIDIWIPCSSVVSAVQDGRIADLARERKPAGLRIIDFTAETVSKLDSKQSFISYMNSLALSTPGTHECTTATEIFRIVMQDSKNPGLHPEPNKYILKPVGVDDRTRDNIMTTLPLQTPQATMAHIVNMRATKERPLLVQKLISGPEYCTHSLVIEGKVRAFTVCPSSDLLMHYEALPPDSGLHRQMLEFTEKVAQDGGEAFTGHLAFDFLAESSSAGGEELYAIECNPRVHTAVTLFSETPELVNAYVNESPSETDVIFPTSPRKYYWIGHDFVTLLAMPVLDAFWAQGSWRQVKQGAKMFWRHLRGWKDATFEAWDPMPFLVLYHVYWPAMFVRCLVRGTRWTRVNVSTTKMFEI